jgi:alpha-1,2-mannosyltransferase
MTRPDSLTRREKLGLAFALAAMLGLGAMTVARTAFMMNPKTDFQVYARAAWAVRAGEDPYAVTDNNGWHYVYPPAFAILMAPLADPYPFMSHDGYLPLWLSAAIWYLIGLGAAIYSVHAFASAVLPQAVRGSRRWWLARTVPFFVCFGSIVLTITRGQVNTVLVALVAAGFAAAIRNRRLASGAWLASAAVLKIIPTVLVLFPLMRRDWRAVGGGVAMAALLLFALPAAVWGVPGAIDANRKIIDLVLAPAVSKDVDGSRQMELHGANATHSQSVQAAVHTWMYPDRATRPNTVDPIAKRAHLLSVAGMLALTLFAGYRRLTAAPSDQLLFLGCLCVLMMLATPISHLHYSMFVMPLVCGHWLRALSDSNPVNSSHRHTVIPLAAWAVIALIPALPWGPFEWMRTAGFGTAATIALWAWGLSRLGQSRVQQPATLPLRLAA